MQNSTNDIQEIESQIMNTYNYCIYERVDFTAQFQYDLYQRLKVMIEEKYQRLASTDENVVRYQNLLESEYSALEVLRAERNAKAISHRSLSEGFNTQLELFEIELGKQEQQIATLTDKHKKSSSELKTLENEAAKLKASLARILSLTVWVKSREVTESNAAKKNNEITDKKNEIEELKSQIDAITQLRMKTLDAKIKVAQQCQDALAAKTPCTDNEMEQRIEKKKQAIEKGVATISALQHDAKIKLKGRQQQDLKTIKNSLHGLSELLPNVETAITQHCKKRGQENLSIDLLRKLKKTSLLDRLYDAVVKLFKLCGRAQETKTKVEIKQQYVSNVKKILAHVNETSGSYVDKVLNNASQSSAKMI